MQCLKMVVVTDKKGIPRKVPCGKCAFCHTNRRSQWMFRIFHEMRSQEYPGFFLTLTYDQRHVSRLRGKLSLRFRDVQKFLKCLRKAGYYAKYICVGEYGPTTGRPHYHMMLWTDSPPVELEKAWYRGSIYFGTLTMASAMYCLKYIIQPKQRQQGFVEKTRAQFSKGIGLGYLTGEVYEWHTRDYENPIFYSYLDGRKVMLPRYYKNKIFTKYQCRVEGDKYVEAILEKQQEEYQKALALGVKDPKAYIQRLRIDQALRIIFKTKVNLTL